MVCILVAFFDLRKAFDTVNHKIRLSKLEYYGIRGKAKDLFYSSIHSRQQFISIDGQNSELNKISHGVPQGSVLVDPLLFIIFISELHYTAIHSKVWYFADDTNLLFANNSPKKTNKYIYHDLVLINKCLRANKVGVNTTKTEIIIFRAKNKRITKHLNSQIWRQKETMVRKLLQLQNKTIRIINFKPNDHPTDAHYHSNKILKFTDYIKLLNCMFVKNVLARDCLSSF